MWHNLHNIKCPSVRSLSPIISLSTKVLHCVIKNNVDVVVFILFYGIYMKFKENVGKLSKVRLEENFCVDLPL